MSTQKSKVRISDDLLQQIASHIYETDDHPSLLNLACSSRQIHQAILPFLQRYLYLSTNEEWQDLLKGLTQAVPASLKQYQTGQVAMAKRKLASLSRYQILSMGFCPAPRTLARISKLVERLGIPCILPRCKRVRFTRGAIETLLKHDRPARIGAYLKHLGDLAELVQPRDIHIEGIVKDTDDFQVKAGLEAILEGWWKIKNVNIRGGGLELQLIGTRLSNPRLGVRSNSVRFNVDWYRKVLQLSPATRLQLAKPDQTRQGVILDAECMDECWKRGILREGDQVEVRRLCSFVKSLSDLEYQVTWV